MPARHSPDESLIHDESFVATSHRGLTYPLGERGPAEGELLPLKPGLGWARLPMPGSLRHINIWLLDDADGHVVVDTGLNLQPCVDAWRALLAGPLAGTRLTRIIATHFHPDHVGLAGWLSRKFQAPLWMTRGEWLTVRMLVADAHDTMPDEQRAFLRAAGWSGEQIATAAEMGFGRMAKVVTRLPLGYRRMVEGEAIAIGDAEWQVVIGSGHSPEHACLWNRRDGVLIAGDQVLPRISSNVSLGVTEPEADPLGEWLASIERLLELPDDLLVCPAHGEPFVGLHARLKALRSEHLGRLDILHAYLTEPRRATDCFGRMFRRKIDGEVLGLATGETLAHLRRLEVEGRAVRTVRDGVWWYAAA